MINIKSLEKSYNMNLIWILPSLQPLYKFNIELIIEFILNNGKTNSFIFYLKEKNLIQNIEYEFFKLHNYTFFFINVELTLKGYKCQSFVYNLLINQLYDLKDIKITNNHIEN